MSEPCIKENELGKLQSAVEMIKKEVFNGDNALSKSVPVLSMQVGELTDAVKDLRTVISGFSKFQNETTGGINATGKKDITTHNTTVKTIMIVTAIVACLAFLFSIFNSLKDSKLRDDQYYLEWQMNKKADRLPDSTTRGGYVQYEMVNDTIK